MNSNAEFIVDKLHKIFPTKIIYAEQYIKQAGRLTYQIHKLAKSCQQTPIQWLIANGFVWKETGYVEPDMRPHETAEAPESSEAFAIADYVFRKYPLAGEYILTNAEEQILYQAASQTVKKMLQSDTKITRREEVVLVLETIELLKCWSSGLLDDEIGGTFWKYIFMQYGFNPENSEAAEARLYARFCTAIKKTLTLYKRFFAPEGTQRYYTSLLLHAIAPRQSIESLFNILFDFYIKNLDFQYIVDDISYRVFTKGMRARWDSRVTTDKDLQLRSDFVFSGLQALFRERPGYMAVLCDSIVKKMDAMLRGEGEKIMDPERNYWDYLLFEWFHKKSATERVHAQRERRQQSTEYVATTSERIYVQYFMKEDAVGLSLPKIRLPEVGKCRPNIYIFQQETCIFEDELAVTGNDLCLTTKSRWIPLEITDYDYEQKPNLYVEIEYLGKKLYHSGNKLQREYILFDAAGNDHIPKSGIAYLFTGNQESVEFSDENGVYRYPCPGQLYRLQLEEISSVTINGLEIFVDKMTASRFRHHTSIRRVNGLRIVEQGKYADLFSSPFTLFLRLPDGENQLRYQVSIDGTRYGLGQLAQRDEGYLISVPTNNSVLHRIRVIDIGSDIVQYEYNYVILPGCRTKLDRSLYRGGVDEVTATVFWCGECHDMVLPLPQDADSIVFSLPGLPFQFEMDVPVVHCTCMGKNAFTMPKVIWHKDFDSDEFVNLRLPSSWEGQLMLDTVSVPAVGNQFELGNELRASRHDQTEEVLWLSLKNEQGCVERYEITTIVFTPRFLCAPLEVMDRKLCWQAENNYFGDTGVSFQITCDFPEEFILSYQATTSNTELATDFDLPYGQYPYQISLKKKSVFASSSSNQVIFRGNLVVGDSNEFLFEKKEIHLGDALCWSFEEDALKTVVMRPDCGILTNLVYQGTSIASGESVPAPYYTSTMCFVDSYGVRRPFNAKRSSDFELVNPVGVWIINEHLLILRCVTEDAVYIDKRYSTIVNRSPSTIMDKMEQQERLMTPDYFKYQVKEVPKFV